MESIPPLFEPEDDLYDPRWEEPQEGSQVEPPELPAPPPSQEPSLAVLPDMDPSPMSLPPSQDPSQPEPPVLDPSSLSLQPSQVTPLPALLSSLPDKPDTISFACRPRELIPVREKKRPRKSSPVRQKRRTCDEALDEFLQKGCGCASRCFRLWWCLGRSWPSHP